MKRKNFIDNQSYFDFIRKYKDKIKIIKVYLTSDKVKLIYENKG